MCYLTYLGASSQDIIELEAIESCKLSGPADEVMSVQQVQGQVTTSQVVLQGTPPARTQVMYRHRCNP